VLTSDISAYISVAFLQPEHLFGYFAAADVLLCDFRNGVPRSLVFATARIPQRLNKIASNASNSQIASKALRS
jgi:uncharacterized alpha-E superfamily protein